MSPDDTASPSSPPANPFTGCDVAEILREKGWLMPEPSPAQDRAALADLLSLVFSYDAHQILASVEAHAVLSRYAARDVLRELALLLLSGGPLTPERFQEIVTALKEKLEVRGRELFHPLRLALAGRSGEGELDRVILLLEDAQAAGFARPVKSARERIVEFCAALD